MIEYLKKLLAKRKAEVKELQKRSEASTDAAEVRGIGETLLSLRDEINELEEQIKELEENGAEGEGENGGEGSGEGAGEGEAARGLIPGGATLRNGVVVGSFSANEKKENLDYRNAFMEFVLRGTPIPAELRADQNTLTGDVASVIPTELVNQIIEKFDNVGMILPIISKTTYAAGVVIPTSTVKPVASWVAEGAGSDRQKKTTGSVVFTYHKLRCEVSMSMEVGTMALSAFEAKFVENVAKAMVYAIENAVINGSGSGQPTGILTAEVPEGQSFSGALSFAQLATVEGAIPVEYETGAKWCMNKKTFAKIMGLTDKDGQPVARVNYGVGAALERAILGRDVVVTPYVADGVAFVYDFSDYVLNTIYDMGISKKQDWETEDLLTKAVMSVDGKPVDNGSLVKLTITDAVSV